jgi:hypothetical protein
MIRLSRTTATQRTLLAGACLALWACSGGSASPSLSPASTPGASTTASAAPSSAGIALHETPDNLGCDSIAIDYNAVTFHIDPAAAEHVSAMTDTGVSLVTYWPAGFSASTAAERSVRDAGGKLVASDGEVLQAGQGLHGYRVCLSTSKLDVMLTVPSEPPEAMSTPGARETLQPNSWTITIVDDLRVRSEPRISDDSTKYEPLLPKGTTFEIVRGPVVASGYSWYLVKLAPSVLRDGITQGWLAEGDREGTPWIKNIPID